MRKGTRTIVYDQELRIEAYHLKGILQPFPNHFHEDYVIGYVEAGERHLSCKNKEYTLGKGNIVLFNPRDNHACVQRGDEALDYRAINISKEVMLDLAAEVTGRKELPGFSKNVVSNGEAICYLRPLHERIMANSGEFEKEEYLLLLLSLLIQNYGQPFEDGLQECREEIENACAFIESHYAEAINLEQLCRCADVSKSTLLRSFTKSKGVTPYRYLEAVRINEAKKLLEKGASSIDAAMQTGFSDQSHFTNYFSRFIGLSPGMYRAIFSKKVLDGESTNEG